MCHACQLHWSRIPCSLLPAPYDNDSSPSLCSAVQGAVRALHTAGARLGQPAVPHLVRTWTEGTLAAV